MASDFYIMNVPDDSVAQSVKSKNCSVYDLDIMGSNLIQSNLWCTVYIYVEFDFKMYHILPVGENGNKIR